MDVANASLLDEASACAEAIALAHAHHKNKRTKFFVSDLLKAIPSFVLLHKMSSAVLAHSLSIR